MFYNEEVWGLYECLDHIQTVSLMYKHVRLVLLLPRSCCFGTVRPCSWHCSSVGKNKAICFLRPCAALSLKRLCCFPYEHLKRHDYEFWTLFTRPANVTFRSDQTDLKSWILFSFKFTLNKKHHENACQHCCHSADMHFHDLFQHVLCEVLVQWLKCVLVLVRTRKCSLGFHVKMFLICRQYSGWQTREQVIHWETSVWI